MIYLHIPFCRSFCTYCGFYSELAPRCASPAMQAASDEKTALFGIRLAEEIRSRKEEILASRNRNTLYLGGGTPSVLPLSVLSGIISTLDEVWQERDGHHVYDEFTIEVNPEDVVGNGMAYLEGLRELGVNRVSMGVQSFDDSILKWMNRRHSSAEAVEAFRMLRQAGFDNISIDLIFGISHLSDEVWADTVHKAVALGGGPEHISAYQLSVEEDSVLEKLITRGRYVEAPDEQCRRQYDILCRELHEAGYHHYEISNFAKSGREAMHNSAYWSHEPYAGFGPGAHSFDDVRSVRSWDEHDLDSYLSGAVPKGEEHLNREQLVLEHIMLGLRTAVGVSEDYLRLHCNKSSLEADLEEGLLCRYQDRGISMIRIPESSFFISDSIIASLV